MGGQLLEHLDHILGLGPDLYRFYQLQGADEKRIGGSGGSLLPLQSVLKGEGDQRTAASAEEERDQADHAQGGFQAKFQRGVSRR